MNTASSHSQERGTSVGISHSPNKNNAADNIEFDFSLCHGGYSLCFYRR